MQKSKLNFDRGSIEKGCVGIYLQVLKKRFYALHCNPSSLALIICICKRSEVRIYKRKKVRS